MKKLLFASFVLWLTLWAVSASAEELTLEQAIKLALENNQLLQASEHNTAAAEWAFRRSISSWLPHASFQWGWSHPDPRTFDRANQSFLTMRRYSSSAQQTLFEDNYAASVQVVQPLFNASSEYLAIHGADINERIARLTEADQSLQLVRKVKQAYYNAGRSQAMIRVAHESLRLAQESLKLTQARVEVGQAAESELLRWEAQVASAEGAVLEAENAYAQSIMALAYLIGRPIEGSYQLAELSRDVSPDALTAAERAAGAGENTTLTVDRHPSVRAAVGNIDLAEVEYDRTWGSMLPSANLTYTYDWATNDTPLPDGERSWTLGVGVSLPLFQGFGAVTGMLQTDQQVQSARLQVEDYKRTLLQQAYAARLNLRSARLRVITAQKAVKSAAANQDLVRSQMEVGIATNLQLLDAQLALRNAQSDLLNAVADFYSAMADWDYVTAQARGE